MTYNPFKMKGSPMKRNFGIGSPARVEEEKRGSVEEKITPKEVKEGKTYSETAGLEKGVIKSASMVHLERNEPPKDSSEHAAWLKAYNTAKAKHLAGAREEGLNE